MRMISGLALKYLKGDHFVISKRYETALPSSRKVLLTRPNGLFLDLWLFDRRRQRMPVQGDDPGLGIGQEKSVNPRCISRCNPQSDKTPCRVLVLRFCALVGCHDRSESAATRCAARRPKVDPIAFTIEAEIPQVQWNFGVKTRIFVFFDDHDTGQPQRRLLHRHAMGMVPKCAASGETSS